ncbi:PQQ-binding-like beta-propeller repeat protein [Candidatus Bipolaricaulota bacterium]|nr:PQQ-binding-like beta-propeller repeat protein [Candidatus Bipolaricaulota bacterium]
MLNSKATNRLLTGIIFTASIFALLYVSLFASLEVSAIEPGRLKWRYRTEHNVKTSPAIAPDGTIYVGSRDHNLYALTPNGNLKWKYHMRGEVWSSPAISKNGTIYAGSTDSYLYALTPDGGLKWRYETGGPVYSSPAIGSDGTVYVGSDDNNLYALTPNGAVKWRYKAGGGINSPPAIGKDGTIYVVPNDNYLYALTPQGDMKWKFEAADVVLSPPAIGKDGTVYVGSNDYHLYALTPQGDMKWKFKTGTKVLSSPAIGPDSTIYLGSGHLYALTPQGDMKWKFAAKDDVFSSPAIGSDGTIYIGSYSHNLYALTPNGAVKWRYKTETVLRSSPTIGPDSTIYLGSHDHHLYAIEGESGGLADSPWPMYSQNPRHTSRVKRGTEASIIVNLVNSSDSDLDGKVYLNGSHKGSTGWNGKYKLSDLSTGSYTVKASKDGYSPSKETVYLSGGEKKEITLTLDKENQPPTASFNYSPDIPNSGKPVTFVAAAVDPDGSIERYIWAFGDGSSSSLASPTHEYSEPGTYTVGLKVVDNEGATSVTTKEITVRE